MSWFKKPEPEAEYEIRVNGYGRFSVYKNIVGDMWEMTDGEDLPSLESAERFIADHIEWLEKRKTTLVARYYKTLEN